VAEEFMMLLEVSSETNELAIEKQKVDRCERGIHFLPADRQKPYMTAAPFQQYTTIVLIEFIDFPWINDEFTLKPVTLLIHDFETDR
jgi:hypothetical protein